MLFCEQIKFSKCKKTFTFTQLTSLHIFQNVGHNFQNLYYHWELCSIPKVIDWFSTDRFVKKKVFYLLSQNIISGYPNLYFKKMSQNIVTTEILQANFLATIFLQILSNANKPILTFNSLP